MEFETPVTPLPQEGDTLGAENTAVLSAEDGAVPVLPRRPSRVRQAWYFLTCEENLRRYLCAAGPWLALLMVEVLNKNDPFTALTATQVTLNILWYYCIFWAVRLVTGRLLTAAVLGSGLCFGMGLANHYVLTFRGRIIFPCDLLSLNTALNVAADYD